MVRMRPSHIVLQIPQDQTLLHIVLVVRVLGLKKACGPDKSNVCWLSLMLKVLNKSGYRLSEWHQEVYCISKPWQPLKSWTFPVDIIFLPPCPVEALVSFSVTHVWLEKMFSPRWFRCSCMPCMAMVVPLDEDLHRDRVTAWPYANDGFASFILNHLNLFAGDV